MIENLESIIANHRPGILKIIGSVDGLADDQKLQEVALFLHPLLPFPLRMAVKKETLAKLLIDHRARVIALFPPRLDQPSSGPVDRPVLHSPKELSRGGTMRIHLKRELGKSGMIKKSTT